MTDFEPGDLVTPTQNWPGIRAGVPYVLDSHASRLLAGFGSIVLTFDDDNGDRRALDRADVTLLAKGPGWKLHKGGENPAPGKAVEVWYRGGARVGRRRANSACWSPDVVAYRVVEDALADPHTIEPVFKNIRPGDRFVIEMTAREVEATRLITTSGNHILASTMADDRGRLISITRPEPPIEVGDIVRLAVDADITDYEVLCIAADHAMVRRSGLVNLARLDRLRLVRKGKSDE